MIADLPWNEDHPAQLVSARRQAEREGRAAARDCLDDVVWDEGMPHAFDAQRWALEAADQARCLGVPARWRPVFERAFVRYVRSSLRFMRPGWELSPTWPKIAYSPSARLSS
jgi:hypothetical protein